MIYYWPGDDNNRPSGGFKTHYLHVEALNALGIPAAVLQHQPGWVCPWLTSTAPVVYLPEVQFTPNDIIVTNEIQGPHKPVTGLRMVVFNQNCHYTFRHYPIPPAPDSYSPYLDPDTIGVLVCSDHDAQAIQKTFPQQRVAIIPHWFPPEHYPLGTAKKRQIAYMPRKHPDEAQQVFGYLHYRGLLKDWQVVAIDGMTNAETLQVLRDSLLFFAFGYPEGYTLPPFEAMASGCGVIGYGGFSADQYLKQFLGVLVPSANTMAFVERATPFLKWPDAQIARWGAVSRERVLASLTKERQYAALEAFWRPLTK